MACRRTEMANALRDELARFPVRFAFCDGGVHPYVRVTTTDGRERRIVYSGSPRSSGTDVIRRDVRRVMRELQIEPIDELAR